VAFWQNFAWVFFSIVLYFIPMDNPMNTFASPGSSANILYGRGHITVPLPGNHATTVIEPHFVAGLPDEHAGFLEAVRSPIGDGAPLAELISSPNQTLAIVTADGTRPVPNSKLIPWLLDELRVKPAAITVITGTGAHRPNTPEELLAMFGERVMRECRVINHNAFDASTQQEIGVTPRGSQVRFCKDYVQADVRVTLGFIEPHFFAGFSGGPKALYPGIAAIENILNFHDAYMIGHPKSTWGVLEENPLQLETRAASEMCPPDFMINVTLNGRKDITGFYAGEWLAAHRAGCADVLKHATVPFDEPFDVVVTSNSGFPLDQNLYQAVKGMSAAAQIVKPGGTIISVSECSDGIPSHGNFYEILTSRPNPRALLDMIEEPGYSVFDQWEAQKLALIQMKAEVQLYSTIPVETVRQLNLHPLDDLEAGIANALKYHGPQARLAILPQGPLTIPYIR
jgi:nickel-dependent lactate racemase